MNFYQNTLTSGLAFFSCVQGLSSPRPSPLHHHTISTPLIPIQFMRNSLSDNLLMGLIYSEVDVLGPPDVKKQKLYDEGLSVLSVLSHMSHTSIFNDLPVMAYQNELLKDLGFDSKSFMGKNEALIQGAFSGKKIPVNNMFDLVNNEAILKTMYSIDSYDLDEISNDPIIYRAGYPHERVELNGIDTPIHKLPVLSNRNRLFASQFGSINLAPLINNHTKRIVTIVLAYAPTLTDLNHFTLELTELKKRQEKECFAKTTQITVISGYPGIHYKDSPETPTIICGY